MSDYFTLLYWQTAVKRTMVCVLGDFLFLGRDHTKRPNQFNSTTVELSSVVLNIWVEVLSSSSSSMDFWCAYYSLNIGALHESDKTLRTEGLKLLNIKSSSKKVRLQLLSELRWVCNGKSWKIPYTTLPDVTCDHSKNSKQLNSTQLVSRVELSDMIMALW